MHIGQFDQLMEGIRDVVKMQKVMYEAYIAEGFTKEQAFRASTDIVIGMITSGGDK